MRLTCARVLSTNEMKWLWNLDFCSWSCAGLSNVVYFAVNLAKYPCALWSIGAHKINYACNVSTIQQRWVSTGLFFPYLAWKISPFVLFYFIWMSVFVYSNLKAYFMGKILFLKTAKQTFEASVSWPPQTCLFYNKLHTRISVNHGNASPALGYSLFFCICTNMERCVVVLFLFPYLVEYCVFNAIRTFSSSVIVLLRWDIFVELELSNRRCFLVPRHPIE